MALNSFVKRGENTFEKLLKNSLSTLSKPADLSNFESAIALFISSIVNGVKLWKYRGFGKFGSGVFIISLVDRNIFEVFIKV